MVRFERRPFGAWVAAALLLLCGTPAIRQSFASGIPARCGRALMQEIRNRGEAQAVVTLRPARRRSAPSTKARVDEVLQETLPSEVEPLHRLESVPVFIARVTGRGLERLLADPRVSQVDLDGLVHGADAISAAQIGADRVHALAYLGDGVTVAVLDSGTDILENPDLDPALSGEECFCSRLGGCCPDGSARQSGPGAARTVSSHGPGVMGIIASRGVVAPLGIAPMSRILMVRVLDDSLTGTFSDILLALDWVVTHGDGVRVVNLSIAAGPYPAPCDQASAFNEAVAQLSAAFRARGGVIVAASGNHASTELMGSPACVTSVISVGAVNMSDQVQSFSDGGESLDLLAPGAGIRSTSSFGREQFFSGTSFAAPHVAASAALLISANPALSADDLEARLESRGIPVVDPRSLLATPRVDVFQALLLPMEVRSNPRSFSYRSRGRGLALVLEPGPPFAASDLDPQRLSATLGDGPSVPIDPFSAALQDEDGDGVEELVVHLNRRLLLAGISGLGDFPLVVEGAYQSGVEVKGATTLKILSPTAKGQAQEPTP